MEHNKPNTLKNTEQPMAPGLYLQDCMEAMKLFPDGFFDLAIVDPPYGDGQGGSGASRFGGMFSASINGTATRNTPPHVMQYNRFGGRFDRYKRDFPKAPAPVIRSWSAGAVNGRQSMQTT